MTNREAHPGYASYPVGMRVKRRYWSGEMECVGPDAWHHTTEKCYHATGSRLFDDSDVDGDLGIIILHDPRTAGKPFAFAPVGDGTGKPSALLVALREAEAAIQRAIEMETNKGA